MQFQEFLNDAVRDKFVCGLNKKGIREHLLAEKTLTLETALDLVQRLEYEEAEGKRKGTKRPEQKQCCGRCHSRLHLSNNCRFKETICYQCNTKGHLGKACQGRT